MKTVKKGHKEHYNNGSFILFFKTGREVHGPEHRLIMIILLRDWCVTKISLAKQGYCENRWWTIYLAFSLLCTKLLENLNNASKNKLHSKSGPRIFGFCNTFERCSSHQEGEAAWPTCYRLGLAMWRSRVRVPLWPPTGLKSVVPS